MAPHFLKDLLVLADTLDAQGLTKEADSVDQLIALAAEDSDALGLASTIERASNGLERRVQNKDERPKALADAKLIWTAAGKLFNILERAPERSVKERLQTKVH